MTSWINLLSDWINAEEQKKGCPKDPDMVHAEGLIQASQEVQEAYADVMEKLIHERSNSGTKKKNL